MTIEVLYFLLVLLALLGAFVTHQRPSRVVLSICVGIAASSVLSASAGGGVVVAPVPTVGVPMPIPPRGHIVLTIDGLYLISTGSRLVLWEGPEGQEVAAEMAVNRCPDGVTLNHRDNCGRMP